MIGHYLLSLTPEQEDRVLTLRFEPLYSEARGGLGPRTEECVGCLLQATGAIRSWGDNTSAAPEAVGWKYEELCVRFGAVRVNMAIRNRILANQARRALQGVREYV